MAFVDGDTIGIGIAAVAAIASALSAYTSRLAVDRAHRAFVWPAISHRHEDGRHILRVRLHNDGSGVAYDVRWSVGTLAETKPDVWDADDADAEALASQVIRALRPGERLPPTEDQWLETPVGLPDE